MVVIVLSNKIRKYEVEEIKAALDEANLTYYEGSSSKLHLIMVNGSLNQSQTENIRSLKGVTHLIENHAPYPLASRDVKDENTTFEVKGQVIGGDDVNMVAGPCSVESREQIFQTAELLYELGFKFIRGGAYKPRTSPYSFQGLGHEGLKMLREAADAYDLRVVSEVIDYDVLDDVYNYADILQVGSRNMFNYYLLKQLGKIDKPILLKRGMFASIKEWLLAAEYILNGGNDQIILCERGVRTFDQDVRNQMDIAAISLVKELSHLPVWADPSQGSGVKNLIEPLSKASIAAGAHGLMIETHPNPEKALSDGQQSLNFDHFRNLIKNLIPLLEGLGKSFYLSTPNLTTN